MMSSLVKEQKESNRLLRKMAGDDDYSVNHEQSPNISLVNVSKRDKLEPIPKKVLPSNLESDKSINHEHELYRHESEKDIDERFSMEG